MLAIQVFTASWCVPCKKVAPLIVEVCASKNIKPEFIDIEEHPDRASKNGVKGVPTVLVLRNGAVQTRLSGAMDRSRLLEAIED